MYSPGFGAVICHFLFICSLLTGLAEWDVLLTCPEKWHDGSTVTLVCEVKKNSLVTKCRSTHDLYLSMFHGGPFFRCNLEMSGVNDCKPEKQEFNCTCKENDTHIVLFETLKVESTMGGSSWVCTKKCRNKNVTDLSNPLILEQRPNCKTIIVLEPKNETDPDIGPNSNTGHNTAQRKSISLVCIIFVFAMNFILS